MIFEEHHHVLGFHFLLRSVWHVVEIDLRLPRHARDVVFSRRIPGEWGELELDVDDRGPRERRGDEKQSKREHLFHWTLFLQPGGRNNLILAATCAAANRA